MGVKPLVVKLNHARSIQYRAHMRQDKEKTPGVFGKEIDCVDEETWFNTKSAKQNTKNKSFNRH